MATIHVVKVHPQTGQALFHGRVVVRIARPINRRWPCVWENVPVQGVGVRLGRGQGRRRGTYEDRTSQSFTLALWEVRGMNYNCVTRLYGIPFNALNAGQIARGNGVLYSSANPQFRGPIQWNTLLSTAPSP